MIIVNLKGGLGNQMFQYAIGFALAKKKKTNLFFDVRFINEYKISPPLGYVPRDIDLDIFGIKLEIPSKKDLLKVFQFNKKYKIRTLISIFLDKINFLVFRERKRTFDERFLNLKGKIWYLDGYWQSEKYFNNLRKELLNIFNFNSLKKLEKNKKFLKNILSKKSVCVNVRRADFINIPEHDVLNIEYYKKAIDNFGVDKTYIIFSDDIEGVNDMFNFLPNKIFYTSNKDWLDLYTMSLCEHNIICNSTFSWWAAYLNENPNKVVITPKKWFGSAYTHYDTSTLIPNEWVILNE
jgi:hypothetical protein